MSGWERVDERPAPRTITPELGDWDVTATRGSAGFMVKLSPMLYEMLSGFGSEVHWMHDPDGGRFACIVSSNGGHAVCTDRRISLPWALSTLYGNDMLGQVCRAEFIADRSGVGVVIYPRDHSMTPQAGEQQELPL